MRAFCVISALLAVACAAPQFGYEQHPVNPNGAYSGNAGRGDKYLPPSSKSEEPIVHKQFYSVSAPEDPDNVPRTKHLVLGKPQRNYRVVFIKAPTSGAGNVKYSAEFAPQEEKTVIYVLNKKDKELDANDIATPAPTVPSKPEVFFIKYRTDDEARQAQKEIQEGWQALRDSTRLQYWEYKKALVHLQVAYGIFPYYKVSIENRYNKPHDYIIALDEGDLGLPDKYFYNVDQNDEIVHGYNLLLRDFAISMGIVAHQAEMFADEVFHYEKRIVNHLNVVKINSDQRDLNEIKTLAEMKSIAPLLPIFETLQALFPHTNIKEDTEILVKNVEVFHELSNIISTSDKRPINNFIIWSLARHLLPNLSQEYRKLIENYDHSVYGRSVSYPRWMICAKTVRDWLPFAVDALQQRNKDEKASRILPPHIREYSGVDKTVGNDEFLKLMFYSLKNQLEKSVDEAEWIDNEVKCFIKEKITAMRLQIGVPEEALKNRTYIKDYYNDLLLNNLFFVDHLQSIWNFRKVRMEEKLKALNIVDAIISEMYTADEPPSVAYSNMLNMLIISRDIEILRYYDYRFPISINFARIGTDIMEVLIDAISTFVEQYKADNTEYNRSNIHLPKVDIGCITAGQEHNEDLQEVQHALKSFHITLSAAKITAKALSSFISAVDSSTPIMDSSFDRGHTYETLQLKQRLRLPGLRSYNENELFTLAYMQKHCSTSIADNDYAKIKPHVEQQLAERYLFNATWNHIQFLPLSSSCPVPSARCSNIL